MKPAPIQLPLRGLPIDPGEMARLPIFDRIEVYGALGLDPEQREAVEEAVRRIKRGEYRGRR